METTPAALTPEAADKLLVLQDVGTNIIYLMGLSFILGSLFTIFILLVLDFMRARSAKKNAGA